MFRMFYGAIKMNIIKYVIKILLNLKVWNSLIQVLCYVSSCFLIIYNVINELSFSALFFFISICNFSLVASSWLVDMFGGFTVLFNRKVYCFFLAYYSFFIRLFLLFLLTTVFSLYFFFYSCLLQLFHLAAVYNLFSSCCFLKL